MAKQPMVPPPKHVNAPPPPVSVAAYDDSDEHRHDLPKKFVRDNPFEMKEGTTIMMLQECMDGNAYMILLDLMNWARLWDDTYNGRVMWDDATMRAMMYPFLGFGNNPTLWHGVANALMPLVQAEIGKWSNQEAYREANSMTWAIISSVAPTLAASSRGFDGMQKAHQILEKGFVQ